MNWPHILFWWAIFASWFVTPGAAAPDANFASGVTAYEANDFARARDIFSALTTTQPGANVWRNLGNAHWQLDETAAAILAWERAASLNPFDSAVGNNLRFARRAAQLEAPDLTWYEIASAWLPLHWWAMLGATSFWSAIAMLLAPLVLRHRKSAWQQAGVALGLGLFLLCLPANYGAGTRARLAIIQSHDTILRFTPTAAAEAQTRLAAGEPVRCLGSRGDYVLVSARRTTGWVRRVELETILAP